MSTQNGQLLNLAHIKQRYSFNKVCRIFNLSKDTLLAFIRDGFPRPDGTRVKIYYIPLGRKREFEVDEVERVYQDLRESSVRCADVLPFDEDEESRDERRERGRQRREKRSRIDSRLPDDWNDETDAA